MANDFNSYVAAYRPRGIGEQPYREQGMARTQGSLAPARPKILKVKKVGDAVLAMSDVGDLYLLSVTDDKPVMTRFDVQEDGND